jgi:NAD(P)-dependent dehydrogenase (short-subunit alcohol dehydrogenase family)
MIDLTGKVAYITGGSKGIGLGVAKKLLGSGIKVAISGRSKSSLDAAVQQLGSGPDVLALVSDVTKLDNEQSAVEQIIQKWGKLDVVLANAGVGHFAPVDELSENDWHQKP